MLVLVTPSDTLDTFPAPAPRDPRTLARWEDRTAPCQDAERKEAFKHRAAPMCWGAEVSPTQDTDTVVAQQEQGRYFRLGGPVSSDW